MSKKIHHSYGASGLNFKDGNHVIHQDMQCLHQIDKHMKIPAALYHQLSEAFMTSATFVSMPPSFPQQFLQDVAMVSCQTCVDTWFLGDDGITKKYPLSGTDKALPDTMHLHGLDDFVLAIKPLHSDPQDIVGDNTSV